MKTAIQLHETLDDVIDGLNKGKMDVNIAREISTAAKHRISLMKVELDYRKFIGNDPDVARIASFSENKARGRK